MENPTSPLDFNPLLLAADLFGQVLLPTTLCQMHLIIKLFSFRRYLLNETLCRQNVVELFTDVISTAAVLK